MTNLEKIASLTKKERQARSAKEQAIAISEAPITQVAEAAQMSVRGVYALLARLEQR